MLNGLVEDKEKYGVVDILNLINDKTVVFMVAEIWNQVQ